MVEKVEEILKPLPETIEKLPIQDEKFLSFVTPPRIDNECLFGISLKNGVKIISLIVLIRSIGFFVDIFTPGTLWRLIVYLIMFLVLLGIAFYAYFSTTKENYSFAKTAYVTLGVIFAYESIKFLCKSLLKIVEFITPWDMNFFNMNIFVYIFGYGVYLFIILYLIWVLYCYMLSLKGITPTPNNEEVVEENI